MNRPGLMVYKCRRCGGLVRNTHVPDIMFGVISVGTIQTERVEEPA